MFKTVIASPPWLQWRAKQSPEDFSHNIAIIGIVNVTPDSFSDGGRFVSPDDAVEWACRLIEEGADGLDIGGESSRPGAAVVAGDEEIRRVVPVIAGIRRAHGAIPLSIDTTKSVVARAALDAGADVVNDISAGRFDPAIFAVATRYRAPFVLMHMQGTPRTMQTAPTYTDVVGEVRAFLAERIAAAVTAGISRERLIIDPGIGFGKTVEQNVQLVRHLDRLADLGCPILIGTSRKSFLGHLLGGSSAKGGPPPIGRRAGASCAKGASASGGGGGITERAEATLASIAVAVDHGARLVRVHDVAATRRFLRVYRALRPEVSDTDVNIRHY